VEYDLYNIFINIRVVLSVLTVRSITGSEISRKLEITENQWCLMKILISLLKPFYILTIVFLYFSVSMVRPLLYKVTKNHYKSPDNDNTIIKDFRKTYI